MGPEASQKVRSTEMGASRQQGPGIVRRVSEAFLALVMLVLCLPTLLVVTLGTTLSLRAWPFFTQARVGVHGSVFRIVKVRTLPRSTSPCATKYEVSTQPLPWFCRLVRRLHLDEIPQLWLVVTGRMGLVGPRPEMLHLHDYFDSRFAVARTSVRPGCTGLWQISAHSGQMIHEHPEYDEFYLAHRSLRLDAWIVVESLFVMLPLGRRPAVDLADVPAWASKRTPATEPALRSVDFA